MKWNLYCKAIFDYGVPRNYGIEEKGNIDRYLTMALKLIIEYYLSWDMSAKKYTEWFILNYKYIPDYLLFLKGGDWVVGEYTKASDYEKQLMAERREQLRKELADDLNKSTHSDDWVISFIHPKYVVKFETWFTMIKVTRESRFECRRTMKPIKCGCRRPKYVPSLLRKI